MSSNELAIYIEGPLTLEKTISKLHHYYLVTIMPLKLVAKIITSILNKK